METWLLCPIVPTYCQTAFFKQIFSQKPKGVPECWDCSHQESTCNTTFQGHQTCRKSILWICRNSLKASFPFTKAQRDLCQTWIRVDITLVIRVTSHLLSVLIQQYYSQPQHQSKHNHGPNTETAVLKRLTHSRTKRGTMKSFWLMLWILHQLLMVGLPSKAVQLKQTVLLLICYGPCCFYSLSETITLNCEWSRKGSALSY